MFHVSAQPYILHRAPLKTSPSKSRDPYFYPRYTTLMAPTTRLGNDKPLFPRIRTFPKTSLPRNSAEEQDQRRQVYLRKVRIVSEDKKWHSRTEQVRHDHWRHLCIFC